ncbi:serine/threonine-protein kinase [Candidatus Methylocalor cossyra]|uniref:Non-specific serine/threonine protein kinase n=1 Tax=Candidatus Methylocalor cossyra TaxID=3108543 RepID=A0ABM9NGL5_9GAMM
MHVGSVVGGYKVLERIGEGGMGTVFRAMDVLLEREVALKLLRPELTDQPDLVLRFQQEAIALARLNHPHIVTLHHMFRDGDQYYMVLELVSGETLDRLIQRCGAVPWQTAVPLICQALLGLEHAHILKVVHRDIKPSNLILTQTGIVKLMDFGVARMLGKAGLTQSGLVVGTVRYLAPEQLQGKELDHRADLYGIGMVLYEMLTGQVPFDGKTDYELMRAIVEDPPAPPRTLVTQLPRSLEAVVLRALAKAPEDRQGSAAELRSQLEAAVREALAEPHPMEGRWVLAEKGPEGEGAPRDPDRTCTQPLAYGKARAGGTSAPAGGQSPFKAVALWACLALVLPIGAALWLRREGPATVPAEARPANPPVPPAPPAETAGPAPLVDPPPDSIEPDSGEPTPAPIPAAAPGARATAAGTAPRPAKARRSQGSAGPGPKTAPRHRSHRQRSTGWEIIAE